MANYRPGTFIQVPNKQVIVGQKPHIQSVYLWIVSHADSNGLCFPSRNTISKESGTSIKSVDRAIFWLEKNGILKKINRFNGKTKHSNLFQIKEVEGGSVRETLGRVRETLGVASGRRIELTKDLTKSTQQQIGWKKEKHKQDIAYEELAKIVRNSNPKLKKSEINFEVASIMEACANQALLDEDCDIYKYLRMFGVNV